jgi:hypothetical protein
MKNRDSLVISVLNPMPYGGPKVVPGTSRLRRNRREFHELCLRLPDDHRINCLSPQYCSAMCNQEEAQE